MFNLVSFTTFAVLFFKQNTKYTDNMLDLILLSFGLFLYACTCLLFWFDPDPFDYFRYCFKPSPFAMIYYYLYSLAIVGSIVLLQILRFSWASLIPFGCLFLLTLIYRPYRLLRQNLRCCFNLLIIIGFLSLRVFIEYKYGRLYPMDNFMYIFFLGDLILMFLGVVIGLVFVIHHIIYICFLKPKQ